MAQKIYPIFDPKAGLTTDYALIATGVGAALIALIFLNGFVKSPEDMSRRVAALSRGWLLGKRARPLFGTNWNELFGKPLSEVRRQFNIEIAAVDELLARGVAAEGAPERAATAN